MTSETMAAEPANVTGANVTGASVKGWCPGALRPMETGDGLVVRLRLTGGILACAAARKIAALAHIHGNGQIDLSQRANLQIRGVSTQSFAPLIAALSELDILDDHPDTEAIRNIVAPPLAGLDRTAPTDGRALVAALESRLRSERALWALPGKFGYVVDDGGALSLAHATADIRFQGVMTATGPRLLVEIGGTEPASAVVLGTIAPEAIADAAEAIARVFLDERAATADRPRRLASILARTGAAPFAAAVAQLVEPAPLLADDRRTSLIGIAEILGAGKVIGAGAPFGRLDAEQLVTLADVADVFGKGELRLTPWRAVLVPHVRPEAAAQALAGLDAAGLIVAADDPLLAVVACPGRPACRSASVDARTNARALAPLARRLTSDGLALHVSGCEKGCARPGETAVTLVGHDGRYDLVIRGRACDEPVARGLSPAQAKAALAELAEAG
jgi:precorrin-3B synthase